MCDEFLLLNLDEVHRPFQLVILQSSSNRSFPGGLVVRIRRSHLAAAQV